MKRVVDTNVLVASNDLHGESFDLQCVLACLRLLRDIQHNGHLVLDAGFEILREYMHHARERGQPGVGDAFLKWAKTNEHNPKWCTRVPISTHPDRGYEEFPDDPDLVTFDPSDRKFVAVSIAHGERPPICHASDRGWRIHAAALSRCGVAVQSLCPAPSGER